MSYTTFQVHLYFSCVFFLFMSNNTRHNQSREVQQVKLCYVLKLVTRMHLQLAD